MSKSKRNEAQIIAALKQVEAIRALTVVLPSRARVWHLRWTPALPADVWPAGWMR